MLKRFIGISLALLLVSCDGGGSPPPPPPPVPGVPWAAGPTINGVNYSPGVVVQAVGDGTFVFAFPQAKPGVHYITRSASESARGQVSMSYAIDAQASVQFIEVDCGQNCTTPGPGKLRLFIQRCGDDWLSGPKASFRFWAAPLDLAAGEQSLTVALVSSNWTNAVGQYDVDGFAATLGALCSVGFTFGGMFAGHGAYATGPANFLIKSYVVGP